LLIKDRKNLLRSIDGVQALLEDIKERFSKINQHVDFIENQNKLLTAVNTEVTSKVIAKIQDLNLETLDIKTDRVHSKDEMFKIISKEIKVM